MKHWRELSLGVPILASTTLLVLPLLSPRPAPALPGPNVATIQAGNIHIDGQPFFPFGFYHVSWMNNGTMSQLYTDMRELAAAGFNTLHPAKIANATEWALFLDDANTRGIKVLSTDVEVSDIPLLKGKPAVLGWDIANDANYPCGNPPAENTPSAIRARHDSFKAADPNHLTYISGVAACVSLGQSNAAYMSSADLVAMQSYPIDNPGVDPNPLMDNYVILRNSVNQAVPYGRPIIANLQTFAWPESRLPTAAEARALTYGALMAGVKGIINYTYYDSWTYLPNNPTLMNELTAQASEIQQLKSVLLNGTRSTLTTGVRSVIATQWVYQGKTYVAVLNTSYSTAYSVSLTFPAGTSGPAQALFAGRPSGMTFQNGNLTGIVRPTDVHVYSLNASDSPT